MRMHWAWGLSVMLVTPASRGETKPVPPQCLEPRITLDSTLAARQDWQAAAQKTRLGLAGQSDIDTCAAFEVTSQPPGAIVRAVLPDGRAAERSLQGPHDLPKTVTALISLPPTNLPVVAAAPTAVDVAPLTAVRDRDRAATPVERDVSDARRMAAGFELGLGPASRLAYDSRASIAAGVALFAQVRAEDWLVGVTGRASRTINRSEASLPNAAAQRTYALGIALGRRLKHGGLELDLLAETVLGMDRFSFIGSSSVLDGDADDVGLPPTSPTAQATAPREGSITSDSVSAGIILRASIPLSPGLRGYGALDADRVLSRIAVSNTAPNETPTFPTWSAGLSIGVAWSPL
jgi:hypothetical protein